MDTLYSRRKRHNSSSLQRESSTERHLNPNGKWVRFPKVTRTEKSPYGYGQRWNDKKHEPKKIEILSRATVEKEKRRKEKDQEKNTSEMQKRLVKLTAQDARTFEEPRKPRNRGRTPPAKRLQILVS